VILVGPFCFKGQIMPKKDKAKKDKEKKPKFDIASIYNEDMDTIARRQGVESSSLDAGPAMSTGLLCLDLQLGGGIRAAMYTTAGAEQSAKTTTALTIMASAIKQVIPLIELWDYEGSTKNSKRYVHSIIKGAGVKITNDELFGKRDEKTGKWVIRPRVRYHSVSVGEKFFDYVSEVLRKLPDKKYINKKWWLVFEDNKINKAKYGEYADDTMPRRYGKGIWLEAPDDKLQGIVFVDSYPAMNSTANDEEDANNGLALQARMFSKHLPRIKGRLAEKMVALVGVNQLRAIPMAMYGPKEAEPGGNALKYNSDARLRNTGRNSNQPLWPKKFNKEHLEEERSVEFDGKDQYRYIHSKAVKNKLWTPGRQAWYRLWHEDGSGMARGFDPFWDTLYYLRQTGQLTGKGRDKLTLNLEGVGKAKALTWGEYKAWVLGDKEMMIKISKKAGFKPMSLRSYCFKQMADGTAERLYVAFKGEVDTEE